MKKLKKSFTVLLTLALLLTFFVFPKAAEDTKEEKKEVFSSTQELKGDVNNDGKVNSSDALLVLKHAVKSEMLTGKALEKADVNKDGVINSSDALLILRIAVGMDSPTPTPTPIPTSKQEIVELYNTTVSNTYKQDKIVLEGFTDIDFKVNKFLIDGEEDDEMTEMFEDVLSSTEYEDINFTFINGETSDGDKAEDIISSLELLVDDIDTATAVPHGDGYKMTFNLYPWSQTLTEDELASDFSNYTSYTEEVSKIEIIAVTDGQGRIVLIDLYTFGNIKATTVEEDVTMYMDFDVEQRDIYTFSY